MSIPQAIRNIQFRSDLPGGIGNGHPPLGLPQVASPTGEVLPGVWIPVGDEPSPAVPMWSSAPVVRARGLWLYKETIHALNTTPGSCSPLDIARDAVAQGLNRITELSQGVLTQHALMVAWGEFAQEIGLIQKLSQVPMPQKAVVHTPQAKVLTFLMGILTGITHLKDLNEGPHPLAHDWAAIRAWRLAALPHYTGVSRTLAGCDKETVAAILQGLQAVSQPFIDQEVQRLRAQKEPLLLDLDLAPRRVSNTSTTYPEAEFGWQGDGVGLGYDAALVALTSPTYDRLFLAGSHHPRNPIALPRLQKMIREAEARLGVRPRRRTELVTRRLHRLEQQIEQRQGWLATQRAREEKFGARLATLPAEITHLEAEVAALEAAYRAHGRTEKPHLTVR